jgi:phosphoribosyl-AMP cyclohydrolase
MMTEHPLIAQIRWTSDGLVPAIVQDAESRLVLMMAWMNRETLLRTLETGESHFYSRSRRATWRKGETSGNVQRVRELRVDCDGDVLLLLVHQAGGACHHGYRSCFFRTFDAQDMRLVVNAAPVFDAEGTYKRSSTAGGDDPSRDRTV